MNTINIKTQRLAEISKILDIYYQIIDLVENLYEPYKKWINWDDEKWLGIRKALWELRNEIIKSMKEISEMDKQQFLESLTKKNIEKKVKGIEGWGLTMSENLLQKGKIMVISEVEGCIKSDCLHKNHSPRAPHIRWIPEKGKLIFLGEEGTSEEAWKYYCWSLPEKDVYLAAGGALGRWHELKEIAISFKYEIY